MNEQSEFYDGLHEVKVEDELKAQAQSSVSPASHIGRILGDANLAVNPSPHFFSDSQSLGIEQKRFYSGREWYLAACRRCSLDLAKRVS